MIKNKWYCDWVLKNIDDFEMCNTIKFHTTF